MTTLLTGGGTRSREALDDDVDLARDRVLVTRAQAGDRGAFDDLYVRYYRRLYRFCLRRLHDGYEAEDVAQEAFARAWRALPGFAGDRRFYPWLSVIAAHLCTDVLRRRNRSTPVAEFHQGNVASTDDGGEELMVAAVDSDLVSRAFRRLSDRHQRILNLREGSGWSYQRIADHEGVGITAVETLLWRARQALKREFAALAGTEGRTAAWLGGLVSLATLRRLLRLPAHAMRRLVHVAHSGAAVAMGSAAAAAAMVVAAALGGPLHGSQPAGAGLSSSGSGHVSAASARPSSVLGNSAGAGMAPGTSPAGATSDGTSGTLSTGALNSATGALNNAAGTLNGVPALGGTVSGVSSTVQNVASGAGSALNGAASGVGSLLGSAGSTVNSATGSLSQTASGAVGAVQGTLGTVGGATGTSTPSLCTTVLGVSTC